MRGWQRRLNPRRFPQRLVHPALPARPARAERGQHFIVDAQGDLGFGRAGRPAAADYLVANAKCRLFEPLVGQFRRVVGVNPNTVHIFVAHARLPFASR